MNQSEIRAQIKETLEKIGTSTTRRVGHGESCKTLIFDDYAGDGGKIKELIDYCESLLNWSNPAQ